MKFTLDTTLAADIDTACLVIGVFEKTPMHGSAEMVDQACAGALKQLIKSGDVSTDWKDTTLLHGLEGVAANRILVLGCGKPEKFTSVRFDSVCATAGRFLRDNTTTSAHICLHEMEVDQTTNYWRVRQAAVNLERGNYRYTTTKPTKDDDNKPLTSATFNAGADMQAALEDARGFAKGYLRSKELGNLPPNICNPAFFADTAKEIAKNYDNVSGGICFKVNCYLYQHCCHHPLVKYVRYVQGLAL